MNILPQKEDLGAIKPEHQHKAPSTSFPWYFRARVQARQFRPNGHHEQIRLLKHVDRDLCTTLGAKQQKNAEKSIFGFMLRRCRACMRVRQGRRSIGDNRDLVWIPWLPICRLPRIQSGAGRDGHPHCGRLGAVACFAGRRSIFRAQEETGEDRSCRA